MIASKKLVKCRSCGERFGEYDDLISHIEDEHEDEIPKSYTTRQYEYSLRTGKTEGKCIMCGMPTRWNEATGKYHRFCDMKSCKDKYRDKFKQNMIGKFGKVHLLSDPDQQRKMLANRSISGEYTWSDGKKIAYTGTYELDFLRFLDILMEFDSADIMSPSPHTYYYTYKGETKFYIPDFFIPSLNLEVEIKDGGDNPNNHHKIQDVDKVKEKLKDEVLLSQKEFSYVKLANKGYSSFFEFLYRLKQQYNDTLDKEMREKPIFIVTETVSPQPIVEAYTPPSEKEFIPVYILLTYTKTVVARMVQAYTKDPYSHASIGFDPSMKNLYSFGRKTKLDFPTFISEDIMEGIYKDRAKVSTYGAYVLFVSRAEYDKMQERLEFFKTHGRKMRYSFVGLVNYTFGRETHRENEYFCSQFVAEILQSGRPDIVTDDPSLYSPYSISQLKNVYFIAKGKLPEYDGIAVERRAKAIRQKIMHGAAVANESFIDEDIETLKCMDEGLDIPGMTFDSATVIQEAFYGDQSKEVNKTYKYSDRFKIGFTLKNFDLIFSNILKGAARTGNFEGIRPNLIKLVERTKTVQDLAYLRRDANAGKAMLKHLARNRPDIADKVNAHIEWIGTDYISLINKRTQELRGTA